MAIKDTSRKPYIVDNDTNVKVGIDLPFRRGDERDGFFATTSTTIEAVKNNMRNLLQTEEGERFFQPNLGINEIRVKILFNLKQDPNTLDSVTLSFSSNISEPESSTASGVGGGY
jgi:hypothetical protein